MGYDLKRTAIGDQIFFNSIIDKRYKTNRLSVNFVLPLEKETVSAYALLPNILRKGTKSCPDFTQFSRKLAMLYGTYVGYGVSSIGDCQVISLSTGAIDDCYALNGEPLLEEASKILAEVVLEPALENGVFSETSVAVEKQSLIDLIQSEINEKRRYALNRAMSVICAGEPAGINKYGYIEDVEAITPQSLTQAYQRLIETARIEIMFVGCGEPETAFDIFRGAFSAVKRKPISFAPFSVVKEKAAVLEETDRMNVSQSKLVLGFRTGVGPEDPNVGAVRLMLSLYGGTPSSKLFLNVREKMSLCYYCAARPNVSKGIAFVDCGVEHENIEKAKTEILNQLEAIQNGDFIEEELEFARLSMLNSFRSVGDSAAAVESWYLAQVLYNTEQTPETEAERIAKISRESVIAAAKRMKLDTVYLLTSENTEKEGR